MSRRELHRNSGGNLRKGAAALVALAMGAGIYGFISTADPAHPQAALAQGAAFPDPERTASVSRSVDRFPLDDATARTIVVTVDGEVHEVDTRARTLSEALKEAGIEVGFHDEVSAPLGGEPTDATIERVSESIETVEEKIPFTTTRTNSGSLVTGTEQVQTRGRDGTRTATKRVLRKDGEIVAEEILAEAVGSEPVTEVILVGTAPKPAPVAAQPQASTPVSAPAGGSPKAIAQEMLSSFGWGQDQFSCLNILWMRESNWNPSARNPYSGAYGIPQSLPGSKMASAGADWQTNPATQIRWGLGYIKGRYGSPCGAWSHSQRTGWY